MTAQQQRAIEAFRVRTYYGVGDLTQQGAAATVGSSLLTTGNALNKIPGGQIPGAILDIAGALSNIVAMFGPNPYNTYTTEVVNRVEADVMQPNLAAWQALPDAQKTIAAQQAAEANFNQGWNYVVNACSNPQLGSAGINCIKDRDHGGKYDWWVYYYDPIANDPAPAANAAAAAAQQAATTGGTTSSTDTTTGSTPSISTPLGSLSPVLLVGLGLVALAFLVGD